MQSACAGPAVQHIQLRACCKNLFFDVAVQVVIDIDGDGSFLMNCQELATAFVEKLDVKMFILNNQHLGMVVQWEDRFYKKNRAHTYLGHRVSFCKLLTKF